MNRRKVKRLEIYMYDFGVTTGSIQNGSRPVIVIQDDRLNENSPTTVVAAITAVIKKEHLPSHIFIGRRFGLPKPSMVLLEQIQTVNQCDLGDYIGFIDDPRISKNLSIGIKKTLGMWNYTPRDKMSIRCLCPRCMREYMNTGNYIVRRLDPFQNGRDKCYRCNRPGWDYVITEKVRENKNEGL